MKQISKRMVSLLMAFALLIACTPVLPVTIAASSDTGLHEGESGVEDNPFSTFPTESIDSTTNGELFTYTISGDEAIITGCSASVSGGITIPSVIDGYPVTGIGRCSFDFRTDITSVIIPDGVTYIGVEAFWDCNLTSITIPASVTSVGWEAFGCSAISIVYYGGTEAQWNMMSVPSPGNEGLLEAQKIEYNHVHDYSLFQPIDVPATCIETGYVQYTCAYGDVHKEYKSPSIGHDYSGDVHVIDPTCTAYGYTSTQCTRCTATQKTNYTGALGHNCPSIETVKEPTCTVAGSAAGQCTVCKETITSSIAALGHKMVAVPAVDATCTEAGLTLGTKCERCDFVGIAQTTVPATGHSFANGACTGCGLEGVVVHKQGDEETYYNTLEEVLAVTDGTIQLLADVTADAVNLNTNVTLDLNGYTLTTGSVSGKVVDSQDGKGLIEVGVKNATLTSADNQLILWDNTTENAGYRVFNYTFTNLGLDAHGDDESESTKYGAKVKSVWSDLVFTNQYAYTLVASGNSGLQVGYQLSWTPDGGEMASKTFNLNAATVGAWGAAEEGNTGAENYCFYIRVTGFEELLNSGMVTVKPIVSTVFNSAETAVTEMQYKYVKPNPGGLTFEKGFGIVPEA